MQTSSVSYLGQLRTEAIHRLSGDRIITDAPPDNQGKGAAFSPTDLLATSLACCMLTTMGIVAQGKGIPIKDLRARVVKHMASGPRRVARVEVHLAMDGSELDADQKATMEHTARTCPVALSLHPDIVQDFSMVFDNITA